MTLRRMLAVRRRSRTDPIDERFLRHCDLCGSAFQFGMHIYNGQYIARYELMLCRICYEFNHDGFSPNWDQKLLDRAKVRGFSLPEKNANGYYPRCGPFDLIRD